MAHEFYLVLPSNSSWHIYRNNQRNEYRTLLSKEIRLDDKWEVALAEIIYPCSWQNQTNTPETRWNVRNLITDHSWVGVHTQSSSYHNTREIFQVMKRKLTENNVRYVQIQHDASVDSFRINMEKFTQMVFTAGLAESLGFIRQNSDGDYEIKEIYQALRPKNKCDVWVFARSSQ